MHSIGSKFPTLSCALPQRFGLLSHSSRLSASCIAHPTWAEAKLLQVVLLDELVLAAMLLLQLQAVRRPPRCSHATHAGYVRLPPPATARLTIHRTPQTRRCLVPALRALSCLLSQLQSPNPDERAEAGLAIANVVAPEMGSEDCPITSSLISGGIIRALLVKLTDEPQVAYHACIALRCVVPACALPNSRQYPYCMTLTLMVHIHHTAAYIPQKFGTCWWRCSCR